jgi:hypothetical protein
LAAELLGPRYSAPAFDVAERIAHEAPELFGNATMHSWPPAIVWLLAEQDKTVGRYGNWGSQTLHANLALPHPAEIEGEEDQDGAADRITDLSVSSRAGAPLRPDNLRVG